MKNAGIFGIIKNLSDEEIKKFDKYLISPFFDSSKVYSLNKLFKEIIRNSELFKDSDYNKMINCLCDGLHYSKSTLDKQLSHLTKQIKNFLKLQSFEGDYVFPEINLNEYFLKIKNLSQLRDNLKKTNALLNSVVKINDKIFLHSFQNNVIDFTYQIYNYGFRFKKHYPESLNSLENAFQDLVLYFYMQSVGIYVNYIFLQMNTDTKNNSFDKAEILLGEFNNLGIFKSRRKKIFDIYRNMYMTFHEKNNKDNFVRYRGLVEQNLKILNMELINMHYQALINFCMMKDRLGEEQDFFRKESIELLFNYFQNNYFRVDNTDFINEVEFSNFVVRAYSIKEFEMIKLFVENNYSKLMPSVASDMLNYGMAYYYLGKKNYRKVLKHSNSINRVNPVIKFDIMNIDLRAYYELNRTEALLDSIHNYRAIVLKDNVLTKPDKESLYKLLRYLNFLITTRTLKNKLNNKYDAGYYKNLIEKEPVFALKNWLIEKFDEIISRKKLLKKIST